MPVTHVARARRTLLLALIGAGAIAIVPDVLEAQGGQRRQSTPRSDSLRQAQNLDVEGRHDAARAIFEALIANAPDAAARAQAQRRLAMSYGYDANCAKVIELEEQVIAYWVTRRAEEPQNAHYQEGEMANEAARVCIDHGFLDEAERMYRRGSDLGNAEPEPRIHPRSLWDYRLAHAMGRISARRGNVDEAKRWIAEARKALDSDPGMAEGQERYFPYLVGYVALFTGDLATAESELTKSAAGLDRDPFQIVLLGLTYEKMGQPEKAREHFQRAYAMATGSNPPNVFSRTYTRKKLGLP